MGVSTQTVQRTRTSVVAQQGVAFFKSNQTDTTPGSWQVLINETVGSGKQINLLRVDLTCRMDGVMEIYIDSDLIGSGRTGPAEKNIGFDWTPFYPAAVGEVIQVKFRAHSNKPIDKVEAYLQARELTL
jgi:hypothetical protein